MTRINCVPPSELTVQHLVAEYRELPRIFALVRAAIARGERPDDIPDGELWAGGHLLTRETIDALGELKAAELIRRGVPERALALGRDGSGPDHAIVEALRSSGAEVRSNPGHGWGAALARPQSASPTALFTTVNAWLAEGAQPGDPLVGRSPDTAELGDVHERALAFSGAGQQLYAILSEPAHGPATGTAILFNAGAIRRIGPNRMWTEAARRWAAAGVAVIRLDIEGIGDAGGENSGCIAGDESFYVPG